jgi:hypothetical protein
MKTSKLFSTIAFAFTMLLSLSMQAQDFSDLDKSPMDAASYPSSYKISDKAVKVVYSRPQLKERAVSKLAPNDKVWRTGANEAAEISVFKTINLGDKTIQPGTYSLFTIPGDSEWTIILSSDVNVWGSYSYNEANDVARIKAPVSKGEKSLEAFSIAFTDDAMYLGWGTVRVTVPFSI